MDKALVYRISFEGLDAQASAIGKLDGELSALNATVKKQREDLKLLDSLNQRNTANYRELEKALGENITKQGQLSKGKSDLVRQTRNEIAVTKEETGSINQLRAQLSLATAQYNSLSKAERENINVGVALQKNIRGISDELKSLESRVGNNTREVGNYRGALKEAGGALLGAFGLSFGIGAAVAGLVSLGKELFTIGKQVSNVTKTFNSFADAADLNKLRGATANLVSDLQLQKLAVQAKNFNIQISELPKLLEFATIRSAQTGESVDNLVSSIILGLGRKSPQIIDNLGISTVRLGEELKKTPDFVKAVGNIIEQELTTSAVKINDVGTAADRMAARFENAKVVLGSGLVKSLDDTATILESDIGLFDKLGTSLSFFPGLSAATAAGIRATNEALAEYKKELDAIVNTTDSDEIIRRISLLNQVLVEQGDAFGFVAKAISFYETRLIELNNQALAPTSNSLADLEAALANVREIFNKAQIGSKEFEDARREIKRLQDQIEAVTNPVNKGSIEALRNQLSQLQEQLVKTNSPKRIRQLTDEIKLLNAQIAVLEKAEDFSLPEVVTESTPDNIDAVTAANIKLLDSYKGLKSFADDLEKDFQKKLNDAEPILEPIVTEEQLREERAREIQAEVEKADAVLDIANSAINTIAALKDIESQNNINRINRERDAQLQLIQETTLSEEAKAEQILRINKQADAKLLAEKKKNAEAQKKLALVQIAVDTARGIAAAVAAGAGLIFPANLAAIASGIASVLTGIVSAKAALSQAQEFEQGGVLPAKDGGFIKGNSHRNGGVKFAVGGRIMEAEGGEIIVNKNIQKRPDFVAAISQMNYLTGGKKFETGGIVSPKFSATGVNITAQQQLRQQDIDLPPIQVINNVTDTTTQQNSIIQTKNIASIGG